MGECRVNEIRVLGRNYMENVHWAKFMHSHNILFLIVTYPQITEKSAKVELQRVSQQWINKTKQKSLDTTLILKKKNLAKYFLFDVIVTFLFLMVHATLSSITRLLCMQQVSLFQI